MHEVMEEIFAKARATKKKIVLPEGIDSRVLQAAEELTARGIADVTLLGSEDEVRGAARESGAELANVEVIDPAASPKRESFAEQLYEMRKSKGLTREEASVLVSNPLYFGVMMVHNNEVDGQVSGAINPTADTVRPALRILRTAPGTAIVSSFFIMIVPNCPYGENGLFIYSDCGLKIDPNADQLAEIAISSAKSMRKLFDVEPRVAMLSFSTKGSAHHKLVDKVIAATEIAKERAPDLLLDGELQADSALVGWVGERKAPGSPVAGKANVLIFPDLNSGNIAYKLTERLAGAEAYGPILQGLRKPVNDLSRGCSADDIVNVAAVTALQASE